MHASLGQLNKLLLGFGGRSWTSRLPPIGHNCWHWPAGQPIPVLRAGTRSVYCSDAGPIYTSKAPSAILAVYPAHTWPRRSSSWQDLVLCLLCLSHELFACTRPLEFCSHVLYTSPCTLLALTHTRHGLAWHGPQRCAEPQRWREGWPSPILSGKAP
jgi:hypothetical protein